MSNFPEKIVYVEDDKTMRDLVRKAIEKARRGVLLFTCKNGQELVNKFKDLKPQLVLLDLVMPEVDGPETVNRLLHMPGGNTIPIIFMTGKTKVEMREEYKRINVIGVLHKPFDIEKLADQIEELWKNRKK